MTLERTENKKSNSPHFCPKQLATPIGHALRSPISRDDSLYAVNLLRQPRYTGCSNRQPTDAEICDSQAAAMMTSVSFCFFKFQSMIKQSLGELRERLEKMKTNKQ